MTLAPRENPVLFGHTAAEALFEAAIESGRVHHAWLLTGPAGVGKATLAYRLARRLLGGENANDPASPAFRRVAAGSHADLLTIERGWDEKRKKLRSGITVEQARSIGGFLHRTAAEGGWRVVVVDGADDMNTQAANALLKVLEEPSSRGILFLTADAPGRLLPTIRSRCRRLPVAPLDPPAMAAAMAYLLPGTDDADRQWLTALAEGAPGRGVALAEEGALALAALAAEILAAQSIVVSRMHEVAERATKSDTGFATFMTLLRAGLGQAVRDAARAGRPSLPQSPALHRGMAEWGEVWHALGRLQDETERFNLDQRTAVIAGLELLTGS